MRGVCCKLSLKPEFISKYIERLTETHSKTLQINLLWLMLPSPKFLPYFPAFDAIKPQSIKSFFLRFIPQNTVKNEPKP